MKTCFKCGLSKSFDDFYAHPQMADGHLGKCKLCARLDCSTRRNNKREEVRAYDRKRGSLPHRIAAVKLFSAEHPEAHREGNLRYSERYPEKKAAHTAVSNALRDGKLFRKPCEVCGIAKSQAHHDDYTKPLEVRWLCDSDHKKHHKEKRDNEGSNGNRIGNTEAHRKRA